MLPTKPITTWHCSYWGIIFRCQLQKNNNYKFEKGYSVYLLEKEKSIYKGITSSIYYIKNTKEAKCSLTFMNEEGKDKICRRYSCFLEGSSQSGRFVVAVSLVSTKKMKTYICYMHIINVTTMSFKVMGNQFSSIHLLSYKQQLYPCIFIIQSNF